MDKNHAVNPTRGALQRVATHVLARARFLSTGKFGLRATPGGFGTPAFGASPGDTSTDEPYLYVGPWTAERPGDASYWNAPFGAVVTRSQLMATDDPVAAGVAFARRGVELLS